VRSLLLVLSLVASSAFAAPAAAPLAAISTAAPPVSFNFAAVPVMEFAQATYKNLLSRDFVVSSDLVALDKRISISVRDVPAAKLPAFVDSILKAHGIRSTARDGVYYLETLPPANASSGDAAGSPGDEQASGKESGKEAIPMPPAVPNEVELVKVLNRPPEFIVTALNAAFGENVARPGVGSHLVISAPASRIKAVLKFAALLDQSARSVEVAASFVEVSSSDSSSRGLALVANVLSRKLGVKVEPASGSVSVSSGSYQLVIDALAADGRFKQVSNSRVVGDEAEHMTLTVGDETPTLGQSQQDQQGRLIQSVVYRPSGVILDVSPKVLGSGRLVLAVDGQVSSFQATSNGVQGSPTLVKRQVKTAVSVDDGQVLVIGGMDDAKQSAGRAGFSFLPDSWRTSTGSNTKTDLVLILSARVLPQGG
jgi:general secretion pathway protein D